MTARYRITHLTTYTYDEDVTDSYGIACCRPRDLAGQRVVEHLLWTEPEASDGAERVDADGNRAAYFHVTEPHRRLVVGAVSVVEREVPSGPSGLATSGWEDARPAYRPDLPAAALAVQHALPSPQVDVDEDVRAYAAPSFPAARTVAEAVTDLMHRVHADVTYLPGSTTVTTRVPDVLRSRRGVCQDLAHLMIACLRSHGLAARYVSGYLATDPPAGGRRMVGTDATHAWVQVWVPSGDGAETWLGVDPTNDCLVGERHVTVAWGRDYADVPPVKGVILSDATESRMRVSVDVVPVEPEALRTT